MNISSPHIKNSLFWKISGVFLLLSMLIGIAYVFITAYTSQKYYAETTQRLNANVAEHMLLEVAPFENGQVNEKALHQIMHSMMAVNPAIEVYLLDTAGKILSFVVLDKKVKLNYVSLEPVREFLAHQGDKLVLGDDPRNPGKRIVFSATPVFESGSHRGYVYLVLVSEQFENIAETVWNSYLLSLGTRIFMLSLLIALVLGLGIIWLLTRNLRQIIQTVRQFEQGNLKARIPVKSKGELAQLSHTFNHMAETILLNIQELQKVDKLRRELIANVSHDLRTPLSVIHGYVETLLMKQGSLSQEEEKKYLDIVLSSSQHLKKLVSDLFELSKLEARQVELNRQAFPLSELLEEVGQKYSLLAQEKDLEIISRIEAQETTVFADLRLMERVLQNLLDNAIKHSPAHEKIFLDLSTRDGKVQVQVRNTGVGIPEEDLAQIFDRYYKVEKHYGDQKGTGLGLAIVKNILEVHNSFIQVSSKIHEYTSFSFQLPLVN